MNSFFNRLMGTHWQPIGAFAQRRLRPSERMFLGLFSKRYYARFRPCFMGINVSLLR